MKKPSKFVHSLKFTKLVLQITYYLIILLNVSLLPTIPTATTLPYWYSVHAERMRLLSERKSSRCPRTPFLPLRLFQRILCIGKTDIVIASCNTDILQSLFLSIEKIFPKTNC